MYKCPVRGHEHNLTHVSDHVQEGTGIKAETVECPKGYRWLVIDKVFNDRMRTKRPRWGWK